MDIQNNSQSADKENAIALSVRGLIFYYNETRNILEDIDLNIYQGEKVGLIGPNGAGKTTFFMLACGVLKPKSGSLELFGKPVKAGQFHPEIGMVFQNSDDQLFSPSVWDDVAFGPQNLGLSKEEVAERVREVLTSTGTLALSERPPHHLSGGEKRMVSIAGVMAMRPQFIIYDEPSASLDIRARRRLINFLQTATETILLSSHDLEFVLEVCDRVILLDDGKIIADGDPKDLMVNVQLMEAHGLERPHSLTYHPHALHQHQSVD